MIASIAAYYVIYACIPGLKEMADRSPHVEPGKLHLNVWILMAFFIFISAMIDVGYSESSRFPFPIWCSMRAALSGILV